MQTGSEVSCSLLPDAQHEVLNYLSAKMKHQGRYKNQYRQDSLALANGLQRKLTEDVSLCLDDLVVQQYLRRLDEGFGYEILVPCSCRDLMARTRNTAPSSMFPEGSDVDTDPPGRARRERRRGAELSQNILPESRTQEKIADGKSRTDVRSVTGPRYVRKPHRQTVSGTEGDKPFDLLVYWHNQARGLGYPNSTRAKALLGCFSQWMKKDALTADDIRSMIDAFMASPPKEFKVPPWREFMAVSNKLMIEVKRRAEIREHDDHRFDPEYWIGGVKEAEHQTDLAYWT